MMKKALVYIALVIFTIIFCIETIYTDNIIIKTINLLLIITNTIILTTDFAVIKGIIW